MIINDLPMSFFDTRIFCKLLQSKVYLKHYFLVQFHDSMDTMQSLYMLSAMLTDYFFFFWYLLIWTEEVRLLAIVSARSYLTLRQSVRPLYEDVHVICWLGYLTPLSKISLFPLWKILRQELQCSLNVKEDLSKGCEFQHPKHAIKTN